MFPLIESGAKLIIFSILIILLLPFAIPAFIVGYIYYLVTKGKYFL